LEVIKTFAEVSGKAIPYEIIARRSGDIAICYASPSFSAKQLDWHAVHSLKEMIIDHWNWQLKNPAGY